MTMTLKFHTQFKTDGPGSRLKDIPGRRERGTYLEEGREGHTGKTKESDTGMTGRDAPLQGDLDPYSPQLKKLQILQRHGS